MAFGQILIINIKHLQLKVMDIWKVMVVNVNMNVPRVKRNMEEENQLLALFIHFNFPLLTEHMPGCQPDNADHGLRSHNCGIISTERGQYLVQVQRMVTGRVILCVQKKQSTHNHCVLMGV